MKGDLVVLGTVPATEWQEQHTECFEWALSGKLPYMSEGDFKKEDAIVNLFSKDQTAKVTLKTYSGGTPLTIRRKKEMGKRTTSKEPMLTVETEKEASIQEVAVER